MCIIMVTDGTAIPSDHLVSGWMGNPDGGGYMFLRGEGADRELVVVKGLMTFAEFLDNYEQDWAQYGGQSPFVVHFRIGTRGPNDEANTHPHQVNSRVAMAHNGVISGMKYTGKDDQRSDTRAFVDNIVRFLPRKWLNNPAIRELVADRVGTDKLVFLSADGTEQEVYILNEHRGHWKEGVWYSNHSYTRWNSLTGWDDYIKPTPVKKAAPIKPKEDNTSRLVRVVADHYLGDDDSDEDEGGDVVPFGAEDGDPDKDEGYELIFSCQLCGEGVDVNTEPWCWGCMWCVVCDGDVEAGCECEGFKLYIDWYVWGEEYLDRMIEGDLLPMDAWGRRGLEQRNLSLHDMTDEEVEVVTG